MNRKFKKLGLYKIKIQIESKYLILITDCYEDFIPGFERRTAFVTSNFQSENHSSSRQQTKDQRQITVVESFGLTRKIPRWHLKHKTRYN